MISKVTFACYKGPTDMCSTLSLIMSTKQGYIILTPFCPWMAKPLYGHQITENHGHIYSSAALGS